MKKKLLSLGLALVFMLSMVSCSKPYGDYNLDEYIKVSEYKGLQVEKVKVNVTDKDIDEEIDNRLSEAATTENVTEGTVAKGDVITINYVGKINGEEFDGGSAENYVLTIGSGQLIDGFEDGLIGKKVGGDPAVLKLKFPDDYKTSTGEVSPVAGKDVEFTVTVVSKQETIVPTLNMDFVKESGSEAKDINAYKQEVKEDLIKTKTEEAENQQKQYLWQVVVTNSVSVTDADGNEKYPEEEVDRVYNDYITQYKDYAEQYNMEYGEFIEQQTGMTEEEFDTQVKEYARSVVKQEEVLYYIVEKEKIDISGEEYDEYIENSLKEMGMTADSYEDAYGKSFEEAVGKDTIRRYIYVDKVTTLMLENAKLVDELPEDANPSTVKDPDEDKAEDKETKEKSTEDKSKEQKQEEKTDEGN